MFKRTLVFFCCLAAPVGAQNTVKIRVLDSADAPVAGARIEVRVWSEGAKPILPLRATCKAINSPISRRQ